MPPKKRPAPTGGAAPPSKKSARTTVEHRVPSLSSSGNQRAAEAFLRIVSATPVKCGEAEDEASAAPLSSSPRSSAPPSSKRPRSTDGRTAAAGDSLMYHLATLLHGMTLVTLTAKAQQGMVGQPLVGMHREEEGSETEQNDADDNKDDEGVARTSHVSTTQHAVSPSARVDSRWLEAVTRYCNTRVVLDDVAKVEAAFPDWVMVKWGVKTTSQQGDEVLAAVLTDGFSSASARRPSGHVPKTAHGASNPCGHTLAPPSLATSPDVLTARLYLRTARVPSVEEALSVLTRSEDARKDKASGSASSSWRDRVTRCSAYEAFVQQERRRGSLDKQPSAEARPVLPSDRLEVPSSSTGPAPVSTVDKPNTETNDVEFTPDEEALLATISPELRQSLSRSKLRGVVAQMRKEASREDVREFARIERAQEEERVLATYAHIRSLFGPSRQHISAARLLEALESESPFDDHRRRLRQLSLVLGLQGSGLTAVMFSETDAVSTEGKGTLKDASSASKTLTSLDSYHEVDLERVLVYLDRERGSVQAVLTSLKALRDAETATAAEAATKLQ